MEILVAVLGAGIGTGIMNIVLESIKHKWRKSDTQEGKIDCVIDGLKVLTIDRVKYLGKSYIKAGEMTVDDKETLDEMYKAYKALGGNGHLDTIMAEVKKLEVVSK